LIVYSAICSLDGYIEDADGKFDWAMPSHDLHAFINEQERSVRTYLYGRRMYETMAFWETMDDPDPVMQDYARIWCAAEKIVFSRTLEAPSTTHTRVEREFDADAIRALQTPGDIGIGGAELAAEAFCADLIERIHLFVCPVMVGGGKRALPDGIRMDLVAKSPRSFDNGAVHLEYAR
jgi:dihydrofolate reductase